MIPTGPVRVLVQDDAELVVLGVARMLEPYAARVRLVRDDADLLLAPLMPATVGRVPVVVYSWDLDPVRVADALARGAAGYLSQRLPAGELVDGLERIRRGQSVVSEEPEPERVEGEWPGRGAGLTERESQIVGLIAQGLSNQDIAERCFLSINSVKSYIRSSYRKMGVSSRSQAVLWGIEHGFRRR